MESYSRELPKSLIFKVLFNNKAVTNASHVGGVSSAGLGAQLWRTPQGLRPHGPHRKRGEEHQGAVDTDPAWIPQERGAVERRRDVRRGEREPAGPLG